jgi:23S rRNA pseudouridine1911/1915/1917 synthase
MTSIRRFRDRGVPATEPLDILFEDNHCLAVNKPAGRPSTHFDGSAETVDRLAKAYLKERYAKPGNVFLGVVHRLDKPVSGVLLFAKTSKGAARLCEQFRDGTVEKVYWAVTEGVPDAATGVMRDTLRKREPDGRSEVVSAGTTGGQDAETVYTRLAVRDRLALLELRPRTGRRHQLRIQLASRSWPIVGDSKYGARRPFPGGVALHARSLTFRHPTRGEPVTLTAPPPPPWAAHFGPLLREASHES